MALGIELGLLRPNNGDYSSEVCGECKRPLLKLKWGIEEIILLVCDNGNCPKFRQPLPKAKHEA